MKEKTELLEIVDSEGKVIGIAPRFQIHGNPSLMHRVIHILLFNKKGELLLQKRSMDKDVAPGKWDTSVGGHVDPGEELPAAAAREMKRNSAYQPASRNCFIPIPIQIPMRQNLFIHIHVFTTARFHLTGRRLMKSDYGKSAK